MLGEDSWPPAVDFYDFLKIMDMEEPNSAQNQIPEVEEEVDEEEATEEEDVVVEAASDSSSSSQTPDKDLNIHSEL